MTEPNGAAESPEPSALLSGSVVASSPPTVELRVDVPHSARMYDYYLLRHEALTTGWG